MWNPYREWFLSPSSLTVKQTNSTFARAPPNWSIEIQIKHIVYYDMGIISYIIYNIIYYDHRALPNDEWASYHISYSIYNIIWDYHWALPNDPPYEIFNSKSFNSELHKSHGISWNPLIVNPLIVSFMEFYNGESFNSEFHGIL